MARSWLVWVIVLTWTTAVRAQSPDAGVEPSVEASSDAGPPAEAGEVPPSPTAVTLPDGRRLEVGCVVRVARALEQSMYVICDDGRLLWVDTAEAYVEEVATRGTAVDLFEHSGRLWVELVRHEALALDPGMPGTLTAQPPPAEAAAPATTAPAASIHPFPSVETGVTDWERPTEPEPDRSLEGRLVGWEISAHLRPFLAEGGAGTLFEVAGHYGFSAPVYLRVEIDPIGAASSDDSAGVFGAAALLGFDHETFQLGVGVGAWYVEIHDFDRFAEGLAATLLQSARIGRRDGVHIEAKSTFVWVDGEVLFGGLEGRLQAPIGQTNYLVFQGGGGIGGHLYGEVGARIWVQQADNGRGLYLIPAMGGAGISRDGVSDIIGPSVSLGLEVRP